MHRLSRGSVESVELSTMFHPTHAPRAWTWNAGGVRGGVSTFHAGGTRGPEARPEQRPEGLTVQPERSGALSRTGTPSAARLPRTAARLIAIFAAVFSSVWRVKHPLTV